MEQNLIPYAAVDCLGHGSVLVLAPHPDDEVFGCGGAILAHVAAGDPLKVIVVTDGAHGFADDKERIAHRGKREKETQKAADLLGYGEPVFWRLPDRGLQYGEPLIERIVNEIQESKAELVYAPSVMEVHPDHWIVGKATAEAVWRAEPDVKLVMYEIGVPLKPNRLLDITFSVERKCEAMNCFATQLSKQNYITHIEALNRFRTYTLPSQVQAAEAYFMVSAGELRANPLSVYVEEFNRADSSTLKAGNGNRPLVSVIIRSIDRPNLSEALQSIAIQTYPNIEVVVVNAIGPEHSLLGERCGRYPLRVCGSDKPLHRSGAANYGLDNATGEYLIFLDDDDIFLPDHVEVLMDALLSQSEARVAYAGIREETHFSDGSEGPIVIRNEPFDANKLFAENYIPMHAVLFDRTLLNEGVRFDETFEHYEDWDMWVQLALRTDFLHVNRVTGCYRNNGGCGFGIEPDCALEARAKAAFFEKWRLRWTGEQLRDVIGMLSESAYREKTEAKKLRDLVGQKEAELEWIRSSRMWKIATVVVRMLRRVRLAPAKLQRKSGNSHKVSGANAKT